MTPSLMIERQSLLKRYFQELEAWREQDLLESVQTVTDPCQQARLERQERRLMRWRQAYEDLIPRVPLSRCPFSQEVLNHSFDSFGLDGLWWNFEAPVRPHQELPPTFFAFTGAVMLKPPLEVAPFLCKPGPGVPYVVPRLLQYPNLKAVIRELSVGHHRAFAITYFAQPIPQHLPRANSWGTDFYSTSDRGWSTVSEQPDELDFDLKPWIERGKLLWIPPHDSTLSLYRQSQDCPYLNLDGTRATQRLEQGQLWTDDTSQQEPS